MDELTFPELPEGYVWRVCLEYTFSTVFGVNVAIRSTKWLAGLRRSWDRTKFLYHDDESKWAGQLDHLAMRVYQDFMSPMTSRGLNAQLADWEDLLNGKPVQSGG